MLEHQVWFSAEQAKIEEFYKIHAAKLHGKTGTNDRMGWFWAISPANPSEESVRIHTGIPRLISKKMADILLNNGYNFSVEKDKGNKRHSRLEEILKANDFDSKLAQLIEMNSWSGGTAIKISIDPMFDEPIIEVADPRSYEPVIYRNRIIADKFTMNYTDADENSYELVETYGTDANGAYITYRLYKIGDGKREQVPLTTLEETKMLVDVKIKGLKHKLSYYIPNRLPNSELYSSVLGESDYAGSTGLFNALDEVFSTYQQEFRDSKLNRYFPSNYLMLDPQTGEYKRENAMKTNHIMYSTGISEDIQGKVLYEQGELRSDKHEQAYKTVLMSVCNSAGLSPLTLGITGLESIMASAESQQEREKVSIRTREVKAKILEERLEKILEGLLIADDILHKTTDSITTTSDYEVSFRFEDYMIKSKFDKIEEVSLGLQHGVFDLKTAIEYVHDDMNEDDIMKMLINSKIERGITQFNNEEAEYYFKLFGPQNEPLSPQENEIEEE